MLRRRGKSVLASLIAVVVAQLGVATSAHGEASTDAGRKWPVEVANPGISRNVVDSLPDVVKRSNVKIDPSFRPGSPIIYPNGKLVPGQKLSPAKVNGCFSWFTAYGPAWGGWGATSQSDCAVFGSPGYWQPYNYSININGTNGCTRSRGYNSSGVATWYGTGCGSPGDAWNSYTQWGNILAYPAVQAQSLSVPAGFQVQWRQLIEY